MHNKTIQTVLLGKIQKFDLRHNGNNPFGFHADAERTGDLNIYNEVRVGIYDAAGECVADILVGLTESGEPRVLVTCDGEGEGDHRIAVFPLRSAEEMVEEFT